MEQVNELIIRSGFVGFANDYLERCNRESKSNDNINKEVYTKLVELDQRLGTKASDQLYECLKYTTRSDIIKVRTSNLEAF